MEIFEPENQKQFVDTSAMLDAAVVEAQHNERNLVVERMQKLRALSAAATNWARVQVQRDFRQCLAEVSSTQARVASGELPTHNQTSPGPSRLDEYAFHSKGARRGQRAGGGDAFRRTPQGFDTRIRPVVTQHPRPAPKHIAPMANTAGPVIRDR